MCGSNLLFCCATLDQTVSAAIVCHDLFLHDGPQRISFTVVPTLSSNFSFCNFFVYTLTTKRMTLIRVRNKVGLIQHLATKLFCRKG